MTPADATAFLARLRARGLTVWLSGRTLRAEGTDLTDADRADLRTYAVAVASALRAETDRPRPAERNERTSPQPEIQVGPAVAPRPVLYRGRPITPAEVRECLTACGDLDDYRSGRLSAEDAYGMTRAWLQQSGQFKHLMFTSLD